MPTHMSKCFVKIAQEQIWPIDFYSLQYSVCTMEIFCGLSPMSVAVITCSEASKSYFNILSAAQMKLATPAFQACL